MKRVLSAFISLIIILSGCMKELRENAFSEESLSSVINIEVGMPARYNFDLDGVSLLLNDPVSGLSFSGKTDIDGKASIRVAHGSYSITAVVKYSEPGGLIYIFNGSANKVRVTPADANVINVKMDLNASVSGQIVIKEAYYGGAVNPLTGKTYSNDKYVILYNNSDEIAYLDSLCFGMTDPYNAPTAGKLSPWIKPGTTELRDSVPAVSMAWIFPGDGDDNILRPGEEVVISMNAIDHTTISPNSVNLGRAGYWAVYDPILTKGQAAPESGVKLLKCFWKVGTSNQYSFSLASPAFFIFTLGGKSPERFAQDTYTWHPNQPERRTFDCLMIDKRLIIDGVECFREATDSKRLRPEIDNGYAMTSGTGSGQSVHRRMEKVVTDELGTRTLYMDTNNSTLDFEIRNWPSLKIN
ncbi:hypothetical protein SDC9_24168 [bioreactor metagenome]|uniref:DUF4876 domain-containing protein n=1 Tax=bioreactor metagenome TaxID=1076179 RepID=A0A644UH85_9ZZZZ